MAQVSIQPSTFLSIDGSSGLAEKVSPYQVAQASTIDGTSSVSLPLKFEADLRALPPASLALALIPLVVLLLLALGAPTPRPRPGRPPTPPIKGGFDAHQTPPPRG